MDWTVQIHYRNVYSYLTGYQDKSALIPLYVSPVTGQIASRSHVAKLTKTLGTIDNTSTYTAYYSGTPQQWLSQTINLFDNTKPVIEFNPGPYVIPQSASEKGISYYNDGLGLTLTQYEWDYGDAASAIIREAYYRDSDNYYQGAGYYNPGAIALGDTRYSGGQRIEPSLAISALVRTATTGTSTNIIPVWSQNQGSVPYSEQPFNPFYGYMQQTYTKKTGRLNRRMPTGVVNVVNHISTGTSTNVLDTGATITSMTLTPRVVKSNQIRGSQITGGVSNILNYAQDAHIPYICRDSTYPDIATGYTGFALTRTSLRQSSTSTATIVPLQLSYLGDTNHSSGTSISIMIPT